MGDRNIRTIPQLKADMDKQLEHLVAKEIVLFQVVHKAWEGFFVDNKKYKQHRTELMQYLENRYDEMTMKSHFENNVRNSAREYYGGDVTNEH